MHPGLRPDSDPLGRLLRVLPWTLLLVAVLLAAGRPEPAAAQDPSCEFLEGTMGLNTLTLAGGGRITYLSRPRIGCPDGVRIQADSAISYSAQDMTHLMGSVYFRDGTRELRSEEARYFPSTGRLQASGSVRLEDREDGSIIQNGELVLLRANDFRDQDELTVTTGIDRVRPRATLFVRPAADSTAAAVPDTAPAPPTDTLAGPPATDTAVAASLDTPAVAPGSPADPGPSTPYLVEADRLHLVGEDYFEALGDAVIDRDSIHATARRAEYDGQGGGLLLEGEARLEGSAYDLEGEEIVLDLTAGDIREVTARRNGLLTGDEIRLDAPVIHLFLVDGLLDRLVAVPVDAEVADSLPEPDEALLAQPVATADRFVLSADSLDVRAPAQELDRIVAVGAARGRSSARDSLNVEDLPEIARSDWMEGDTIVATFRPAAPSAPVASGTPADGIAAPAAEADPDDREYVLDRLTASGSARSLYRMLPTDSTARAGVDPPAVHYVTGSRITIAMTGGQVERMEVEGPSQGYHLEPGVPPVMPDSLADTLAPGLPVDTVPGASPAPADTVTGGGPGPTDGGAPEAPGSLRRPAEAPWTRPLRPLRVRGGTP